MREALGLGLLILLLVVGAVVFAIRRHRARIEREYRRGHGDYSKVKAPGSGWLG